MNTKKFIATVLTLSSLAAPVCLSASAAESFCNRIINSKIKSELAYEEKANLMSKFLKVYPFKDEKADNAFREYTTLILDCFKNFLNAYHKYENSISEQECEENYDAMIGNYTLHEIFGKNEYAEEFFKSKNCTEEDIAVIEEKFAEGFNLYSKLYDNKGEL